MEKKEKFLTGTYVPSEQEIKVLRDWITELENNNFFPYHVIDNELKKPENTIAFIHGIMDDGKSYKHWQYILKHYLEEGARTQVLYPETDSMNEEMNKFLEDFRMDCPELWDNVEVIDFNKNGTQKAVLYRNYVMAYVGSIATLKKTVRINSLKYIHIDEYNQHDTRVRNQYVEKYNILLSRNMRGVKKIFMGNNVTTDHVLLHRYNIYALPDGITKVPIEYKDPETKKWEISNFNVVLWNYKRPISEIKEKYKEIPEYYELNMVDFGSHAFFNESRKDQRDFIIDLDIYLKQMTMKFLVQSRIGVLEIYKYHFSGEWYYYIRYDKKAELKLGMYTQQGVKSYVLSPSFEEMGYITDRDMNNYFYEIKGHPKHKYRFQNTSVAVAFQEQLNRYI